VETFGSFLLDDPEYSQISRFWPSLSSKCLKSTLDCSTLTTSGNARETTYKVAPALTEHGVSHPMSAYEDKLTSSALMFESLKRLPYAPRRFLEKSVGMVSRIGTCFSAYLIS